MVKKDLSKEIVKKIKAEKVKMRPKAFFILGSALLGVGFAGFFLFAVLFINRAFYRFRVLGPLGNLVLGKAGIRPFFATFPFLSLLLATLGIIGGIYILKRYEFSYRRSAISLVIGLIALVATVGFILDLMGFGEKVARLRPLAPLYSYQAMGQDFVIGEIKVVSENNLTLVTPNGEEIEVVYDEATHLPLGSNFSEGDRVRAVGRWRGDFFYAQGINEGGLHWRMMEAPSPAPGLPPGVRGRMDVRMVPR